MKSLLLPLPDVTELNDMPAEFAGLQLLDVPAAPLPVAQPSRAKREALQVVHLDDPRASIFALFA